MVNSRLQLEIDRYFKLVFPESKKLRFATVSSFCQQIIKISFQAFYDAILHLNEYYYSDFKYKTYHGYRLLAIDGSIYTLPSSEELIQEFGTNLFSAKQKWLKGQVSIAFDVLNHVCVDAKLDAYRKSERHQALEHLEHITGENLFLFDRGYLCKDLITKLNKLNFQYCFRASSVANITVKEFIKSEHDDLVTTLDYDNYSIKVRLVKIKLNTGETEILVTSLLDKKFSKTKLKQLYSMRWKVEEAYKDFKHALSAENFTGKKVNTIKQEFYARILMYNISMMTCRNSVDKLANKSSKKHKYQTNKRALLGLIKAYSPSLFFRKMNYISVKLKNIITLATQEAVPIRKNRQYYRYKTHKAKKKSFRAYVSVI